VQVSCDPLQAATTAANTKFARTATRIVLMQLVMEYGASASKRIPRN